MHLALLLPIAVLTALPVAPSEADARPRVVAPTTALAGRMTFVENIGQWPDEVRFFARGGVSDVTVVDDGFVVRPRPAFDDEGRILEWTSGLYVRFVATGSEAAPQSTTAGLAPVPTEYHYLLGRGSVPNARGFQQVVLKEIAEGVDVVLREDGGRIAYDLHFAPEAAIDSIEVALEGVTGLEQRGPKALEASVGAGRVRHALGRSWVDGPLGTRDVVASALLDEESARIRFTAPDRGVGESLVIDPTLEFLTYVGGGGVQRPVAIDIDSHGRLVFCGDATGPTPTVPGSLDTGLSGGWDAWVGRLSADGSALEFSTILGAEDSDRSIALGVTDTDEIVVIGRAFSEGFPTTSIISAEGQTLESWTSDVFASSIDPSGARLSWSLRFGTSENDVLRCAGVAPDGSVYLVVTVQQQGIPVPLTPVLPPLPPFGFDDEYTTGVDAQATDDLVVRISADGQQVLAATWLDCGSAYDMTFAPDGDLLMSGYHLGGLPTTPGVAQPEGLGGYALSMAADLSAMNWATYVNTGTNGAFDPWSIGADAAGGVYVAGRNGADDAFVHSGAFQPDLLDPSAGYILKLSPRGTRLIWGSFLGEWVQNGSGYIREVEIDSAGNPILVGRANADGWPVTVGALQPNFIGPHPTDDSALTKFDSVGESLLYSTWVAGSGGDGFPVLAAHPSGRAGIAFRTTSTDLPVTPNAHQSTYTAFDDGAFALFDFGPSPFELLGHGLKGSTEQPLLVGVGTNEPGTTTRLAVRAAEPNSPAFHALGFGELFVPLFGGTLVPTPELVVLDQTDALGAIDRSFTWPSLPAGAVLTVQTWVVDLAAPAGVQATNALRVIAQ